MVVKITNKNAGENVRDEYDVSFINEGKDRFVMLFHNYQIGKGRQNTCDFAIYDMDTALEIARTIIAGADPESARNEKIRDAYRARKKEALAQLHELTGEITSVKNGIVCTVEEFNPDNTELNLNHKFTFYYRLYRINKYGSGNLYQIQKADCKILPANIAKLIWDNMYLQRKDDINITGHLIQKYA